MPKGYVVANIRVKEQEKFQQSSGLAGPVIKRYGGKVLSRGPDADRFERDVSGVVMMIESESKEAANAFTTAMNISPQKLFEAHALMLIS